MRHLLVPAHIKWEDTLKNYQRETERAYEAGQDKVGESRRHISSNSKRNHRRAKQERIRISKKGIHPCVVMFYHVSER